MNLLDVKESTKFTPPKPKPKPRGMKLKEFEENIENEYPELAHELAEFVAKGNLFQDVTWIGGRELFKLSVKDGLFFLQKER